MENECLKKLVGFLRAAQDDPRISTAHIAVYVALFHRWWSEGAQDSVSFSRPEIMRGACILSKATYHHCMRELHEYGYIRYVPSHHPVLASMAFLQDLL